VNLVVGGSHLPELREVAATDRVTFVGLDHGELTRVMRSGADAALVVSPTPKQGPECQDLAFGLVGVSEHDIVTIAHPAGAPSSADLVRWSENGYRLRSAARDDVTLPLSAGAVSPGHARRVVVEYVGAALLDGSSSSAALAVSELVSNALQHAADGTLKLQLYDGGVHIAVVDHRPERWPTLAHADALADAGRGLGIVASVSRAWGVSAVGDAKAVWCEVS
jgi:hypothetical protein